VRSKYKRNERKETVIVRKIKNIPTSTTLGIEGIKKERTELIKETKDRIRNIKQLILSLCWEADGATQRMEKK
jgi:hypothetical protein